MNADSVLLRLDGCHSPRVDENETKILISHIKYLEDLVGCLLRGIAGAKVRVDVPFKAKGLHSNKIPPPHDAQARGDE